MQEQTLRRAMRLSVAAGVLMLIGKVAAWWITGSAAILSDAVESVVHVVAVGFAALSLRLSYLPPDSKYPYGLERITFFSAGFEGAMIIIAAIVIIYEAAHRWISGLFPANLQAGTALVATASLMNLALGLYLVRTGRREQSFIVEANGQHVLTDSCTSFGVVGGLLLVIWTGWAPFDPLLAIAVALNILWTGGRLVRRSVEGLLDYANPATGDRIAKELDRICTRLGIGHHEMRFRHSGKRLLIEVHLLFAYKEPVGRAHELATTVERELTKALDEPASVVTHLEAVEGHDQVHNATIRA
jgi:cation diffusion facilitator family transporter